MGIGCQHVGRDAMTFRAFIGTVAVLAGFAILDRTVDASTGETGSCKAPQAYALVRPGESIAVRAHPTPEADVVGVLGGNRFSAGLAASVVTLLSSQSGWARIALASAKDFTLTEGGAARQYGWIPADLLAVDGRVDGVITAHSQPGLMGQVLTRIENDDGKFRVLGCRDHWLQVINERHGNVWIDRWCAREEGCRG